MARRDAGGSRASPSPPFRIFPKRYEVSPRLWFLIRFPILTERGSVAKSLKVEEVEGMRWLVGLRKPQGALITTLLLAVWVTLAGHGERGHPGVDETIFTIKRPQQV